MSDGAAALKDVADSAVVPKDVKQLRACLKCHLVKHIKQFERDGCENCEDFEREACDDWCTVNFTGIAAIMQPQQSWVSKWLRKNRGDMRPGCYALEVVGDRPGADDE